MIYSQTLKELNEEELSILFLICEKFLSPLNISATFNYLKMLNINVVCRMLDVLQKQALEEKQELFTSLKKKLTE